MTAGVKLLDRNEIPVQYTWNKASIFLTEADFDAACDSLARLIEQAPSYRGAIGESPQSLLAWLNFSLPLLRDAQILNVYANMDYATDMRNQEASARSVRARGLNAQAQAAVAFGDPEMIAIGFERLKEWLDYVPELADYRHYVRRLEDMAAHLRSAEVEELLGQVQDPFRSASTIHNTLTDSDLTFEPARGMDGIEYEIGQGTIGALITHPDQDVRRTSWENYATRYLAMKNSLANCLTAGVKQDVFNARARRFPSSLHASLGPHQIPVEVFHNLIDVFIQNLPVWHRYWRLRSRALGTPKLAVYDIKAPLRARKVDIPFDQAVEWISAGLAPLGEEYVSSLRRGVYEHRWVDVYPNRGKRSGAFSSGVPGATFPFIMMSYNDDIFGMSTLAHELGHSMHSYLSGRTQSFVNARYSLFVAEVASNFNQAMVRAWMLENTRDEDILVAVIEEAMSNFHRYLFIMPTLARFELEIHRRVENGHALNAASLNSLMADLFAEGYGDEVVYDREQVGITWAQFPIHMYMNFYVYQYATGIAGAHALANGVLHQRPGAVEDYLTFLKSGGSLYPLEALQRAGVDLSQPEPVKQTFELLDAMISRLENLVL